jgi:hypothetical protein
MQHRYAIGTRITVDSTGLGKALSGTIIGQVKDAEVYRVVFDHTWESEGILITGERITRAVTKGAVENRCRKGEVIKVLHEFNDMLKNNTKTQILSSGDSAYLYEYDEYDSKGIAEIKLGTIMEYLPSSMFYKIVVPGGRVFYRKRSELIPA